MSEMGESDVLVHVGYLDEALRQRDAANEYALELRELIVRAYRLINQVWGNVPLQYISVGFCDEMNAIYNTMHEHGIEVEL